MPPAIASLVYWGVIVALVIWDRKHFSRTSIALWIPLVWIFIGASRNASEWLGMGVTIQGAEQMAEGSPLDRLLTFGLLVAGLVVLSVRGRLLHEAKRGGRETARWPLAGRDAR